MSRSRGAQNTNVNDIVKGLASLPDPSMFDAGHLATVGAIRKMAIAQENVWRKRAADQAEASRRRDARADVTPIVKAGPKPAAKKKPLPWKSPKRASEADERAWVRSVVLARDKRCVGPEAGLPGACASTNPGRPLLEVHETHQRSTHPGSHLDPEMCRALCQFHHSMVTSPSGEMRELVERIGLIVRATS